MKTVLVGEAYGKNEEQMKHPLVGATGRELSLQMGFANFAPFMTILCRKCKRESRFIRPRCEFCQEHLWPNEFHLLDHWKKLKAEESIHVTNVFNIRPPNNNLGEFFTTEKQTPMPGWRDPKRPGSHLKEEFFIYVKSLWNEIREHKPNLVVAMGNAACWALLGQTNITSLRGSITWTDKDLNGLETKVLPTFHAANILRNPKMRPTVVADFQKAKREANFPEIRRPERWITIIDPTEIGIAEGFEWFDRPARAYACDIETYRGQITIVGFARAPDDALVIVFRDTDSSDPNYWPTPELEFSAWKLVEYGLNRPQPKIFQNGIYDMSYFIRMGLHPKNAFHDTMLWHHSIYPELPKSLGFLASVYCNDIAWKLMRHHQSLKRDE